LKLTKAIELNKKHIQEEDFCGREDEKKALELGIEALKAIELWRKEAVLGQPTHLPGETKED